ncbi:hypothetical protein FGSG_04513 [Fusarium graminearum PH-1]|uniref:hypothetical protein n=1 Tax=Gibberella zeae (strain ATCC MYA-4620 / CBS 123657 / FGSC 9075 / NRRL 31084 / PH-1) TaxID=229533 RepID=UPI00021F186B|nr:hypothetical protein FGSG_04513 [Fusarium graminearum PH-1]ESU08576.1 hypothetical protein FGSG_04513 [Fusarium graminearum PH-1]|eukprot:XP_011321075.1 hypothetical protein FGSG_04513 [Fusarium graminearum PH-1]
MSGQETSPQSPPANTPKHRRPWTAAEDATLRTLVGHFGASRGSEGRWKDIAAGLEGRTAKSKSQGTTPSSSSQMSPTDIGISPAPQNPNMSLEATGGNMAGPSPSPLRDSEGSEDTETPNDTAAPMIAGPAPDLSTNIPDPAQNGPTQCPQPPRPLQAQPPNNPNGSFTVPSPSTWSSLGTMLPPGTSPTNQNLWLGSATNPAVPKDWDVPGDDSIPQSYTEQFPLPTSTAQTIHHHHHHHVHHHFHHYHHYQGGGDSWRQLEQQCEAEALQAHVQQNENGPPNAG